MRPVSITTFLPILFLLVTPCLAFFEHLFNQQQQQGSPHAPAINWEEQFASTKCATYLCHDSMTCVEKPRDCPCPYAAYDKKCPVGGGSEGEFVCARDCDLVERAIKA
ncbi:hypothetical protein JCM11491_001334 [Sporobolomyces phaffii]